VAVTFAISRSTETVEPRHGSSPAAFRIGKPHLRGNNFARSQAWMLRDLADEFQSERRDYWEIKIEKWCATQLGRHKGDVMFEGGAIAGERLKPLREFVGDPCGIKKCIDSGQHGRTFEVRSSDGGG
jgi:hypothetical protein